mgnify:CR=1 FL=1
MWLAAGYALGAASAAMALAAWAVLRTSSECSRAEEAAMHIIDDYEDDDDDD